MAVINTAKRRSQRIRNRIKRTAKGKPRLSVHRSGKHIYAQLIDDKAGQTLAAASTLDKELRAEVKNGATIEAAKKVGALIARRALDRKVNHVVYDRGQYLYHGRVQALADAAREAGLQF